MKDQDVPSVHSQVPGAGDWFPGVLLAPIHVLADGCGGIPVVTMSGVTEAKCPAFKNYQISIRIKISILEDHTLFTAILWQYVSASSHVLMSPVCSNHL